MNDRNLYAASAIASAFPLNDLSATRTYIVVRPFDNNKSAKSGSRQILES